MKTPGDLIPADMAAEIERYQRSLEAKGQPADLPNVLRKLLRLGLNQVRVDRALETHAKRTVETPVTAVPVTAVPVSHPLPNKRDVVHAWAAGLVLPCGIWKSGNRVATHLDRVTCIVCRSKRQCV